MKIPNIKRLIIIIIAIPIVAVGLFLFNNKPNIAIATWWNDSWNYRKSVQVTNNTTTETNVYINLTIDTSATSTIQSDCGDLRFTTQNGQLLNYYIVSGCETAATVIHIDFETLNSGEQSIFYYYGNETVEDGFSLSDFTIEASDYTIGAIGSQEVGLGSIMHWSFNEGYGSVAHDESGTGNNGNINGATWKNEDNCVSSKCLYFDGVDDRVTILRNDTLNIGVNDYTISVWVKTSSTSVKYIVTNGAGNGYNGVRLDSDMRAIIGGSDTFYNNYGGIQITDGKWHNVVVAFIRNSASQFYIDGKISGDSKDISGIDGEDIQTAVWFVVGGYGDKQFNGYIDEVKIYPYARTLDQIKQDYAAGLAGVSSQSGTSVSFGSESDKWINDGLVGYWKMDETATTSGAVDSSGNGNDGTYEGTASTSVGKFGKGGVFDGNNQDFIDVEDSASGILNITGEELSISSWIKFSSSTPSHYFGYVSKSGYLDGYRMMINQQRKVHFQITGDTYTLISENVISENEWHHIVGVYNGDKMKIYIDSIQDTNELSRQGNIDSSSGGNLSIGRGQLGYLFDGNIDEVRIYNRALSKSEVEKLYEWAPGPVLHLKMDEKNGIIVNDVSGNGNDGDFVDTPSWVRGKYGSALNFDGTSNKVDLGAGLTFESALSVGAWVKIDSVPGNNATVIGQVYDWQFQYNSAQRINFRRWSDYQDVVSNTSLDLDRWYYVAFTLSDDVNNNLKIYVDGFLDNIGTIVTPLNVNNSTLGISGFVQDDINFFHGSVDDIRLYNYPRTQKQILEDMYNGNPMNGTVLDLSFDEGYGEVAHDASIFNNTATLYPGTGGTNTATFAMWSLEGKEGGAMEFDGTDDYVDLGDIGRIDEASELSVCSWVYHNTIDSDDNILTNINGNNGIILFRDDVGEVSSRTDTYTIYVADSDSDDNTRIEGAVNTSLLNRWTHVCFSYKEDIVDGLRLYINGEEDENSPTSTVGITAIDSSTESLKIGSRNVVNYFDGLIDEVKIYPYALNNEEIKKDYNDSKAIVLGGGSTESDGTTKTNSKNRSYCVPGDTATCDPPVLELKMDEKTGSVAYDTSGNGNDGTISGASWDRGKYGSGLSFDGTSDYVDVPSLNDVNFPVNGTLNFWMKRSWTDIDRGVFSNYNDGLSHIFLRNRASVQNSLQVAFQPGGGGAYVFMKIFTAPNNIWNNISISWDTDNDLGYIYLNGVLEEKAAIASSTWTPNEQIFKLSHTNYMGSLDNVRLFDYVRTPAQIAYDYNKGKPVAHWSFNECYGSTIHDESGNGNHGTLQLGGGIVAAGTCASSSNSFWYNGKDGKFSGSGDFDSGNIISIPDSSVHESETITISAWINPAEATDDWIISNQTSDGSDYSHGYLMRTEDNDDSIFCYFGKGSSFSGTDSVKYDLNVWSHIVCVNDGTNLFLYLNGELASTNPFSGPIDYIGVDNLYIGGHSSMADSTRFNGQIDEVKIWNYPLTGEQIKSDYNGGAIRFGN